MGHGLTLNTKGAPHRENSGFSTAMGVSNKKSLQMHQTGGGGGKQKKSEMVLSISPNEGLKLVN